MSKTLVTLGLKLPPVYFNAVASPLFDDVDEDGHNPRLTDDALSNVAGNIKPQWQAFRDSLAVSAGAGLTVSIAAGVLNKDDGTIYTSPPSSKVVPPNAISQVWMANDGTISVSPALPVRCLPLATVVSSGAGVTSVFDLRPRFSIEPQSRAIAAFGGANQIDYVVAANAILVGRIDCRNFTLNSGVIASVPGGFLQIVASGTITINGTIIVDPIVAGGGGFSGAGLQQIFLAESGNGLGGGGGHNAVASPKYSYANASLGSGGASGIGWVVSSVGGLAIAQSKGGNGGGALICQAAGAITIGGAVRCDGGNASTGSITSGAGSTVLLPGGGGGSGGLIQLGSLTSITAAPGAQLAVRGGNGANGVISGSVQAFGGGGGGGGYVVVQSPLNTLAGATIQLNGGTAGGSSGSSGTVAAGSVGGTYSGTGGSGSNSGSIGELVNQNFTPV